MNFLPGADFHTGQNGQTYAPAFLHGGSDIFGAVVIAQGDDVQPPGNALLDDFPRAHVPVAAG